MPRSFVTSTHAAPNSWRYSSAWSIALLRADALSKRSRNCGTSALTALVPAKAARVELQLEPRGTIARDGHLARDLGTALMPDMQHPTARRHARDRERPVHRRLGEVAAGYHLDERHHAGMNVAEHADQARRRERPIAHLTPAVLSEVEGGLGGEDVVVEGIMIDEPHGRSHRHDHHAGHVFLVVDRDVRGDRLGSRAAVEIHDRRAEVGRGLAAFLQQRDTT